MRIAIPNVFSWYLLIMQQMVIRLGIMIIMISSAYIQGRINWTFLVINPYSIIMIVITRKKRQSVTAYNIWITTSNICRPVCILRILLLRVPASIAISLICAR
uniref:Uncharacterized protein n=1 Tax=Cacopsylla melanoneura TaxID=428564 RepID=A0A8D8ZP13_9HEMI